jgi:hypothetical protein
MNSIVNVFILIFNIDPIKRLQVVIRGFHKLSLFIIICLSLFHCSIDCLHPRGRFRNLTSVVSSESSLSNGLFLENGFYYVIDPRNDITKTYKYIPMIGLGDFFYYNLMLLFLLQPPLPMTTKIYMAIGVIISVEVGYMATIWISIFRNVENAAPGLPLPVITYSIYTILVDIFMQYSNLDIC